MRTMILKWWNVLRGKGTNAEEDAAEQVKRDSMRNVNRNATHKAAADQSAKDAAAARADSPAEEGGEG